MKQKHDFNRHCVAYFMLTAACFLLTLASSHLLAQAPVPAQGVDTIKFTFAPGKDLFTLRGNEAELARLSSLIDRYRTRITGGRMPLYVDGYCASQPTYTANLQTAYLRASRVKSELITQKGLTEADFVTANYAHAYLNTHNDVVVVTLRIPAPNKPQQPKPMKESPRQEETKDEVSSLSEPTTAAAKQPQPEPEPQPATTNTHAPYTFALRTNLLYDALLLPTLGVEWRITPGFGIRLDGSLSRWGNSAGKVQKMWLLNPEVRHYLLHNHRFYVGISGTYGKYNIYKYPLGSLLPDDTGYQGQLWNAGLTVGYQLQLWHSLAVDFNLGLGYTRSEYDSFTVTEGIRVSKERDKTKSFWGPTQAGISLMWTIGGNK